MIMEKTLAHPFADFAKSSADVLTRLYQVSLETSERLTQLQYQTAKSLGAESAESINVLFSASNTQDYDAVRIKLTENSVQKTRDFLSNFYKIASEAQAEIAQLTENSLSRFNQRIVSALSNAAKDVPGAEIAATALQATLGATTAAVLNVAHATKQVTELAESAQVVASEGASASRSQVRKQA
jgi:phasin family protein